MSAYVRGVRQDLGRSLLAITTPFRDAWKGAYLPRALKDMNGTKPYKGEHESEAKRRCVAMVSIKEHSEGCADAFPARQGHAPTR